jgi:hypothetical protein
LPSTFQVRFLPWNSYEKLTRHSQYFNILCCFVSSLFSSPGWGIDARATGVILTAAYVKIVQLELKDMGTRAAKLVQRETKCLPLMSKLDFERWVKGRESKWKSLKLELYGEETSSVNSDIANVGAGEVPPGLVALWNLMTSSRKDIVGPSHRNVSGELIALVGFGAFATVHTTENNKHIVKVSRYGATAALNREAFVLQELKKDQRAGTLGLSQWIATKQLKVTIGGIDAELPALVLAPRGIRVEVHLATLEDNETKEKNVARDRKKNCRCP